jgi:acyl carrier protein
MTEPEAYRLLTRIFAGVFERDDIALAPELTAADVVGWDSFKQVEILMQIEEALGIKLRSREIDGLRNVGDLAGIVRSRVNARDSGAGK